MKTAKKQNGFFGLTRYIVSEDLKPRNKNHSGVAGFICFQSSLPVISVLQKAISPPVLQKHHDNG